MLKTIIKWETNTANNQSLYHLRQVHRLQALAQVLDLHHPAKVNKSLKKVRIMLKWRILRIKRKIIRLDRALIVEAETKIRILIIHFQNKKNQLVKALKIEQLFKKLIFESFTIQLWFNIFMFKYKYEKNSIISIN